MVESDYSLYRRPVVIMQVESVHYTGYSAHYTGGVCSLDKYTMFIMQVVSIHYTRI